MEMLGRERRGMKGREAWKWEEGRHGNRRGGRK